jgi:hypothetical protein
MNANQPLRPLTAGNAVSAAFRLYNDNRSRYLPITLRATAWMLPTTLLFLLAIGLMGVGGFLVGVSSDSANGPDNSAFAFIGIGFLLLLPLFPLWIFGVAKYGYNETLIAANAYRHLDNQLEASRDTNQRLKKKLWPFLFVRFLVGCILYMVNIASSFFQQIATAFFNFKNETVLAIGGILLFVVVLATWAVQLWVTARLFIPDLIVAEEEGMKVVDSIPRAWSLSQGQGMRILTVLFVAGLLVLPFYSVAIILAVTLGVILLPSGLWQVVMRPGTTPPEAVIQLLWGLGIALLVYVLLIQLIQIVVMPFWQTLKAVIYYDLLNRREGLGLTLDQPDR